MSDPGAPGELLIDLSPASLLSPLLAGPPWAGPGTPAPIDLDVPDDAAFLGLSVYRQGHILDPLASQGARFGLTDAAALRIGT